MFAQKPVIDEYRVRIVTTTGHHFKGILNDITDTHLYIGPSYSGEQILLSAIRKVVIRRNSKKRTLLTGAIIGGLVVGFLSNQSLQKNQTRSSVTYGLTLTSAIAGGAVTGLLVSSAIGNVKSRVVRPLDLSNPASSLQRQLEPFSVRYQQDFIDRLPKTLP